MEWITVVIAAEAKWHFFFFCYDTVGLPRALVAVYPVLVSRQRRLSSLLCAPGPLWLASAENLSSSIAIPLPIPRPPPFTPAGGITAILLASST